MDYHAEAEPFTASLPREHALAILEEIDETKDMLWTKGFEDQEQAHSLPELLAHGLQETMKAECFAMLISRINVQTALAL